jgi:hypothetical protein
MTFYALGAANKPHSIAAFLGILEMKKNDLSHEKIMIVLLLAVGMLAAPSFAQSPAATSTENVPNIIKQAAATEEKKGVMSANDYLKLFMTGHRSWQRGNINDDELDWAIKLLRGKSGKVEFNSAAEQQRHIDVIEVINGQVRKYSPHQVNVYLPVLLACVKSPNPSERYAAMFGLWSLKDTRAKSTFDTLVNDPAPTVSNQAKRMAPKFITHCK